jgi:hypothetical protein
VYLSIRRLPDLCRPAHVVRHAGMTVLLIDDRSSRLEVVQYCCDELTVQELNVLRAAYGEPPVGQSLSPEALEGPCRLDVPASLRLPGENPPTRRERTADSS